MKNNKMRKIAILVAVMMLVMSFSSTGFASWLDQTIKASYRNISVYVNGTVKQAKNVSGVVIEPFIVDGTTYVPLRGIADILGYQVSFNPTTYRIDITGTDISTLTQRIIQQEATIKALEAKLAAQAVDLADMEDQLNDDYTDIEGIDIENIILDGDEDDIEVAVYVDLNTTGLIAEWDALTDAEILNFLQDIVDDILDEFPTAAITGFIEDEDSSDELEDFYINTRDDVVFGSGSSSNIDTIAELEDELQAEFDTDSGFDFRINVTEEDGDDIYIEVEIQDIDLTDLTPGEWDDIEFYLEDLCEFVEDNYNNDAVIIGDFVDEAGDVEFFDYENGVFLF